MESVVNILTTIMVMVQRMNIPRYCMYVYIIVTIAKMSFRSWTIALRLKLQLHKPTLNVVYIYKCKGIKEFSFYKDI